MENFNNSKYKVIYLMRIPYSSHKGLIKVGDTSIELSIPNLPPNSSKLNKVANKRIREYTQTAGISYELLHTELAYYVDDEGAKGFIDHAVHKVLERSGIAHKYFNPQAKADEWFCCDLETAKKAIAAVKAGRKALDTADITVGQSPIEFRPEQEEAITKTLKQFKRGSQMLWNAKMRFGKTLSALEVVKRRNKDDAYKALPKFRRVLILTHRPVVDAGWFEDFGKIFYDSPEFAYGSKTNGDTFVNLETRARKQECCYVYFASMQDLRGSELVGGNFDKNNDIFSTPWDLIIVDEAHEGTQTELGKAVMKELTKEKTKVLRLSGTPFNLLADFKDEEIYTWDYVMEQRAKAEWDLTHPGDHNPYADLPRLNIYTYDLGRLLKEYIDEDIAFNFREFFRTNDNGEFIHYKDVEHFLNLLTKTDEESMFPFANKRYRDIFRHTLWMVPGVKSAKALSAMLKNHPVFGVFDIVNVAGDGDEEEANEEALRKVENAIGKDPDLTRTITLSCGRLTTGVSVKPWNGVLMLSGSFNTAASAYMQTIFRVQTPATINGRVKEDCYVFDFAPDRTLKVLAETAKISIKAGKQSSDDRKQLGDFINFCPIIAYDGSQMKKLNTEHMLQQLKRVYVERVVQHGFEDGYLYNDELMKLSDVDILEFDELKGIIGQTKAMGKTNDIIVNNQGLTNEEYEEKEKLEKKKKEKKELTEEEKKRLEELKKKRKVKEDAISILRGISIRMPLLIYGAKIEDEDKELTIDNFTSLVDAQSWEEFMPRGVTKQRFNAFKKYYDPDIFTAAAKRIRQIARAADKLPIEERIERIAAIFATFRNPDKETVLTPWRVVNMHMNDCLGGYTFFNEDFSETIEEPRFVERGEVTADVFAQDSHLLEINSKSGLYPLYLAYNIYRTRLRNETFSPETLKEHQAIWDKAVAENIFVICKTPMAKSITRRTLLGFRNGKTNMWAPDDLINKIKNQPELFIKKVHDLIGKDVKINAVVGNPPYQIQNEGNGNGADPVYHLFIDIARSLSSFGTMIHPARFLFRAGKTPKIWNEKVLNDNHFKVVDYWVRSTDVFPNVDVKGGIATTLWNENADFGKIGLFSAHPELNSILERVKNKHEISFATLVGPREAYGLTQTLYDEHPELIHRQSKGHKFSLGANIYEIIPEVFSDEVSDDLIAIYGRYENKRGYKWIKSSYINKYDSFEFYKVFVPEANGTGAIGEVLSTPVIGVPVIGHTDTFLSIGKFASADEASACLKYVKSKFARCMLGTLKATQHNPKDTWANVPLQDFTEESDIDWSKSVAEIDAQLYAKYNLSDEEIVFIESMIKPM